MNWAVIMAGGAGTRFWPASRLRKPKQLLSFGSKKTLIEETVSRIRSTIPPERIIILTQEVQLKEIKKVLPQIPSKNFVVEPVGRNTAPAIGLGASIIYKRDPNAVMVCLPADHIISQKTEFLKVLSAGIQTAKSNQCHVTFGIVAKTPETGFGYIERGKKAEAIKGTPVYKVKRFVEKPNLAKAKRFVQTRRYYWNSGMFVWKVSLLLEELQKYQPALSKGLSQIANQIGKKSFKTKLKQLYPKLKSISIDYALMEVAKNVFVIPGDFGWSDVGSWTAFDGLWPKDKDRNASIQKIVSIESGKNIVHGNSKLVALVGVSDLIVVESEDAILVASKDRAQDIRKVIDELKRKKMEYYL